MVLGLTITASIWRGAKAPALAVASSPVVRLIAVPCRIAEKVA